MEYVLALILIYGVGGKILFTIFNPTAPESRVDKVRRIHKFRLENAARSTICKP